MGLFLPPPWPLGPHQASPLHLGTHLQVGDVPVDVHGGRLAVLRDVLVVLGTWLPVHTVDARDGHVLVATGYVPAGGARRLRRGPGHC